MKKWLVAIAVFLLATVGLSFLFLWLLAPDATTICSGMDDSARNLCVATNDVAIARSSFTITAIGAAISAVATIALVITIIFTARATDAAVAASAAAKHAVDLGRDAMRRELRPYFMQVRNNLCWNKNTNGEIVSRFLQITWENEGATPALNVRARTNHLISDDFLPPDFPFPDRNVPDAGSSIGRDKSFSSPTSNIALEDLNAVIASKKLLHLWGWVEYEGSDTDVRFRSEYYTICNFYADEGAPTASNPTLNFTNTLQERFNGIDDTCSIAPKTALAKRLLTKAR